MRRIEMIERLRAREDTARALINATSDTAFLMELDGTILALNDKLALSFNCREEDLLGTCVYDLLDSKVAARRKQWIAHVARTGQPLHQEDERDGLVLQSTVYPLRDPQGRVSRVAVFARDITAGTRAAEELRAANARLAALWSITSLTSANLKSIADHILDTITTMTGSRYGFYGFVNQDESVMTIHSWSGEAMEGCALVDKPSHFRICESGLWAEAVRHRKPLIINDYSAKHPAKNGLPEGHVPLDKILVVPFISQGRITSVAAVANRAVDYEENDVTQLISFLQSIQAIVDGKQAEEALSASEKKFRSLVETTVDWVWQTDRRGRYTYASPNCASLIGYSADELIGMSPLDLMEPGEAQRIGRIFEAIARKGGRIVALEDTMLHKDGRPIVFETNATPIFDFQGEVDGYFGTCRDITDRRHAEADREQLREQLAQSQRIESIGRLAGGIAHDFNNMLSIILGNVEMALAELPPDSVLRSGLGEVHKAAQRSARLTHQLLAFARRQPVTPRILDLDETVASMLTMLRQLIGEDIDLRWLPSGRLDPVRIDPAQIDQLLANLIINARDAIGHNAGIITIETNQVTIGEGCRRSGDHLPPGRFARLAVSDNGCGMDAATRAQVFEPFFTTKDIGKGTGLGLATVYGIVKQNGGFIDMESAPGQGTTFHISLPVHGEEQAVAARAGVKDQRKDQGEETILLVEDEPALLALSKIMLEQLGYRVMAASLPGEALRWAEEHAGEIDLLITDVVMPEMNGHDLAKHLQQLRPNIKCLFMSGYTADVIADHGILDEGIHFIQKPFSHADLARRLRDVLDAGGS